MKNNFIKFAIMSITLVLLSASAIAQNENNNKTARNGSFGVTVSMPSVEIKPKGFINVGITVEEGYHNPYLADENGNTNSIIYAEAFTAQIITIGNFRYVEIVAKEGIKKAITETIYVKAMIKYDGYDSSRSTTQNWGVPLVVTVNPNLK